MTEASRILLRLRPWLGRLQGVLAAAIVISLVVVVARRWDDVRAQDWQVSPLPLALSVGIVVSAIILWACAWALIVRRFGAVERPVREVASVYLYSNLARYLPGAIWNLFARAYLGQQRGLGQRRIWTATVLDLTVAIATGLLLYAVMAPAAGLALLSPLLSGSIALLLMGVVSPPALRAVTRYPGGRASHRIVLGWAQYAAYVGVSCAIWLAIGVAFHLFVAGLFPVEPAFLPAAIGLWSLSVVAGLVAIGVPQGLGVKEGLLVLGLSAVLPGPVATAIAVGSRLWMILCDIVAVGVWWSFNTLATLRHRRSSFRQPAGDRFGVTGGIDDGGGATVKLRGGDVGSPSEQ
jgi:uncharacterized membrane protein YbhN (UPF0104 family)